MHFRNVLAVLFQVAFSSSGIFAQQPQQQNSRGFPAVTPLLVGSDTALDNKGQMYRFIASSTLVQEGGTNMIIDTPTATDTASKTQMLNVLSNLGLRPENIQILIVTHGHPDHFGYGSLFPNARQYFGGGMITGNSFNFTGLGQQFYTAKITTNVDEWSTPGHTTQDISVIVKNVLGKGTIAIVGDLFLSADDSASWKGFAWNATIGLINRNRVLCAADRIIPGHGGEFQVTSQMRSTAQCQQMG